jgi:hypothetical protein
VRSEFGVFVHDEWSTSSGRIDAVLISDSQVLVFEFKLHDSSESAFLRAYGIPLRTWQISSDLTGTFRLFVPKYMSIS